MAVVPREVKTNERLNHIRFVDVVVHSSSADFRQETEAEGMTERKCENCEWFENGNECHFYDFIPKNTILHETDPNDWCSEFEPKEEDAG
jgi:hypothetical protein